jgi:hypothetical protein
MEVEARAQRPEIGATSPLSVASAKDGFPSNRADPEGDCERQVWGTGRHCYRWKRTAALGRTLPLDLGPANGRNRRNPAVAARSGEGPFTIPFADRAHRVLPVNRHGIRTPFSG